MYLGALLAAIALLRDRAAARAVEPMLALGALAAIGYGISARLVPGAIDHLTSVKSGGRLEQPITYWNAEGALAAMGLVLSVRLAGDVTRSLAVRAAAAGASVVLGLGIYLTYSRGAIAAAVIGLVVLLAAVQSRPQLRALGISLAGIALVVAGAAVLPGVASVEGGLGQREQDGAVMSAILAATMLAVGALTAWLARAEQSGRRSTESFRGARRLPALAGVTLVLCLAGLIGSGLAERSEPTEGRGAVRLTSVDSRRYDYWRVAVDAIAEHPVPRGGVGGVPGDLAARAPGGRERARGALAAARDGRGAGTARADRARPAAGRAAGRRTPGACAADPRSPPALLRRAPSGWCTRRSTGTGSFPR